MERTSKRRRIGKLGRESTASKTSKGASCRPMENTVRTYRYLDIAFIKAIYDGESANTRKWNKEKGRRGKRSRGRRAILEEKSLVRKKKGRREERRKKKLLRKCERKEEYRM